MSNARRGDRAERLLDALPAAVITFGRGGAVTAANGAARRWGRAGATVLEQIFPDATPEALDRINRLVQLAVSTGRQQALGAAPLALFKQVGMFNIHAVPIFPATPEIEAMLFIADGGGMGQLEAQLLRVEKLATVGILAAGIAHEVGTPLGVIRGRAELVGQTLGKDHEQTESMSVIIEQIDRIGRSIRALLDFARPRRVAACDMTIARPIERVGELVRYEVAKRQLTLDIDIEPGLPLVHAESDKIEQILVNLVMNAIDATPPGGRITISASRFEGGVPRVVLRVRDTGCGIAPDHLHQVFDPFFTTKALQRGTGLGLAIVDQLTRDYGGTVNLTSTIGQGTTFEVVLPAAAADT